MKLISVIVPVYNLEQYIVDTIQSVLAQTYKHFELIVIDDGSTDRTAEICESFDEPKLKLIRQKNKGANAARNAGLRIAQGDYIAFLDGDDLWLPEKLAKHIEHLEQSPEVGISYSQSAFIDEAGNPMGLYQMPKLTDITIRDILCRNPISNGSCAVLRKEVFEGIKFQDYLYGIQQDFYWDERLQGSQDLDCWFRIALQTDWKMEGIPEILTLYRVNSNGLSAKLLKKQESWEQVIEKTRAYAPDVVARWENPARAYHLRYLARRAVTLRDGKTALKLAWDAIATHPQMMLEEPKRTGVTLAAATVLSVLPQPVYQQLEDLGMKLAGRFQKRQVLQYKT
ncbi:glycosyltransferase family 2 protein [Oscillatoria sp. HE19RPO]|uniref:glycosyltransferase family 2 protein n=1 Tax=Oscillatoria sp. HE19RPO TaxID=2954806 RepID=UPI0020C2D41A|nr:glycosyltransferase family 2 protein [Oscillatoria sp. HE19RPO]